MKLNKRFLVAVLFALPFVSVVASNDSGSIPDELLYSNINIEVKKKVITKKPVVLKDYQVDYKKKVTKDVAIIPVVATGRYSAVMPEPTAAQKNPLLTQVKIRFPGQIQRVGDAITYLLKRSGYRMTPIQIAHPAQRILLQLPLPEIHRDLGPMPLYRALSTLAGEPYLLVVDPVHRLVGYDLKESFNIIATTY